MSNERIDRIEKRQDRQESMYTETIKSINESVIAVKVLTEKLDMTIKYQEEQKKVNESYDERIRNLEMNQASFRPFVDMMKSINQKVWGMIIGGLASMLGLVWIIADLAINAPS